MKSINTPGQALERGGVASFSAPRGGYLTLLSPPSLGNGTMVMLVLLSLRWGMRVLPATKTITFPNRQ
ncbi:MAG: hypothetical protein WBI82_05530 [Sphaerochaeta sp.]